MSCLTRLKLRIIGDIDPARITETLGVTPTFARRAGESFDSPAVTQPHRSKDRSSNGIWLLQSPLPESVPFNEHFLWMEGFVRSHGELLSQIRSSKARFDLFIGIFTNSGTVGLSIPFDAATALQKLQVNLEIEVYYTDLPDGKKQ
jgi:hypothetical protein